MTRRYVQDYATQARSYAPSHAVQVYRRPLPLPPLGYRLAIYVGAGAAMLLIIAETLVGAL